jgi:hypothetical protein
VKRTGSHPNELTREAFNMLLENHERREFGSVASQTRRAGDQLALPHARPFRRG